MCHRISNKYGTAHAEFTLILGAQASTNFYMRIDHLSAPPSPAKQDHGKDRELRADFINIACIEREIYLYRAGLLSSSEYED